MKQWIRELFSGYKRRSFFAWQIELTTRCPLRCRMCIREGFKDWDTADMSMEDFKRLLPYFSDVQTIILQGWGEPLLYRHLIDVIKLTKQQGIQVGFITSGKGLNKSYITELVNSEIDFICFSLAGVKTWTHNSIRINSDLQALLNDIITFNEIKTEERIKRPELRIVYLMLNDNIEEVPDLPQLAKDIGIEEITLINLIHITSEWQERQRVYSCGDKSDYEKIICEAERNANALKIRLRRPFLSPAEIALCEENPLRNLYISVHGEVSPCVFLYPPTSFSFKRIYCAKEYEIVKVSFGNIFKMPFNNIWNNKEYIEFREKFLNRKSISDDMRSYLFNLERPWRFDYRHLPEPPECCKTCHKMLGL